jgi:hypothetical protein
MSDTRVRKKALLKQVRRRINEIRPSYITLYRRNQRDVGWDLGDKREN